MKNLYNLIRAYFHSKRISNAMIDDILDHAEIYAATDEEGMVEPDYYDELCKIAGRPNEIRERIEKERAKEPMSPELKEHYDLFHSMLIGRRIMYAETFGNDGLLPMVENTEKVCKDCEPRLNTDAIGKSLDEITEESLGKIRIYPKCHVEVKNTEEGT